MSLLISDLHTAALAARRARRLILVGRLPEEMRELVYEFVGFEFRARAQTRKLCHEVRWKRAFHGWRTIYSCAIQMIRPNHLRCIQCAGPAIFADGVRSCALEGYFCSDECADESVYSRHPSRQPSPQRARIAHISKARAAFCGGIARLMCMVPSLRRLRRSKPQYGASFLYADKTSLVITLDAASAEAFGQPSGF